MLGKESPSPAWDGVSFGSAAMHPTLYLRLSVTDHCNLWCAYCRSSDDRAMDELSALSRKHLVQAAVLVNEVMPIRKLRLTGGEPLVRSDLVGIVGDMRAALPHATLAMTTNGVRLAEHAGALRKAGLNAVNVSIDTVDPKRFEALTGAPVLDRVIQGLKAAREADFNPIKLNAVLLERRNGDQLVNLVRLASRVGAELRFIELMPNGAGAAIHQHDYLSASNALSRLKAGLTYVGPMGRSGTATRHRFRDGDRMVVVGFITPVSEPFCSGCNRLRIDSRGRLFGCLRSDRRAELGKLLVAGDNENVREAIRTMLERKTSLSRRWMKRHMVDIGG